MGKKINALEVKGYYMSTQPGPRQGYCYFCNGMTDIEYEDGAGWCRECGQMMGVVCPACKTYNAFKYINSLVDVDDIGGDDIAEIQ